MKSDTLPIPRTDAKKNLPEGWVWKRLGEALPIYYGKGLTKNKRDGQGSFAVYGSSGRVGTHSAALTKKAALIVGRKGSVGEVHYSPNPCWPIDTTYYAEENDNINLEYFQYLLRSLQLSKLDKSTAIPGLSRDDYNAVEVAVAPLEQQNRIVSEIEKQFSRLDEAVAALKRVRASLKRYKAAVLKAAVEGRLTEEWRKENVGADRRVCPNLDKGQTHRFAPTKYETGADLLKRILAERKKKWEEKNPKKKYKEPSVPDTSNLPELPKVWVWTTVGQLYDIIGGGTPSTKISGYWDGKIPWITSADIYGVKDIRSRKQITQEAIKNSATNLVPEGSLIVVTRVGLGKIAITNAPLCFSQDSQALVGNNSLLFSMYSLYYLSNAVQRFKYEHRGTTIAGVTKKQLADLEFAIPPLPEQKQIVEEIESRLSVAEEIEEAIDINLKRAERLRQAILKKAFSGGFI